MLDYMTPITTVEDTNSANKASDLTKTHQMELLAQNFDDISMSSSSNARIPYASIVTGRIVVEASVDRSNSTSEENINKYLSFLLPFNSKIQVTKIPGCYKCLVDDSCNDTHCIFCTRGFCHHGSLCKNIYSLFVMCGNGINYGRDERLRVRNSNKRRGHPRYSRYERREESRRIREQVFFANQSKGNTYNPLELWESAVKVWKPKVMDK